MKKVLVIDDSELIHKMYFLMLKKYQGCEVIKALDGEQGLLKIKTEKDIDLVILDINMPVMNGIQFLKAYNKGEYPKIPIIISSTEGREEDTQRGLSLGAKAYLVKPVKSIEFHAVIDEIFSGNSKSVKTG